MTTDFYSGSQFPGVMGDRGRTASGGMGDVACFTSLRLFEMLKSRSFLSQFNRPKRSEIHAGSVEAGRSFKIQ